MGVTTTCRLDEGAVFGPIPSTMMLADPIVLIGHRACDTLPDIHTVKLDVLAFSAGARLAEWVPYVQAARDADEQNMEAIIDDGQLYFRVSRSVPANSELLIWYSEKLAARIGVPQLRDDGFIRGDRYCCSKCDENFVYPNCLRAHMRFRCKYRQQLVLGAQMDDADSRKLQGDDPTSPTSRLDAVAPQGDHITKMPVKRRHAGNADGADVDGRFRAATPIKAVQEPAQIEASAFQRVQLLPAPFLPSPTSSTSGPSPLTASSTAARSAMTSSMSAMSAVNTSGDVSANAGVFLFPGLAAAPPRALPLSLDAPNRMPPPGFPSPIAQNDLLPVNGIHNNNNNNNNENSDHNKMAVELAGKMRIGQYGGHPDPRVPLPFVYRASNPVIDKMLNLFGSAAAMAAAAAASTGAGPAPAGGPLATSFPSLSLAQNWCAKCNTSFRMTSDLVYHMRSHHKREFDPVKRRRDDKLRCEVCGESFRERHHLTRHMTSHS